MVLMKSSQIPKDAVIFESEGDAALYAWNIVYQWESLSQSWALRYGPVLLGSINAMSGLIINKHYRNRFKLAHFGYLSSSIPIFFMPGLLTTLFHNYLVSTDMLLMKSKPCPICYEIRSGVIQAGFGIAYPMLLGPTSALMLANKYGTYRVPDLSQGVKVMFNFIRKHSKPLTGTLAYMAAVQAAIASVITYFEMKNTHSIRQDMLDIEKKLLAEEKISKT